MEQYQWLTTLPALLAIALLGMIMHFFKQKIKGEHLNEIAAYFKDNFKSTMVAIVSTVVASAATYFTMATGQPIDIMAFFGIGYTCDSIFNKWDNKAVP
jgi:hypothetical protein